MSNIFLGLDAVVFAKKKVSFKRSFKKYRFKRRVFNEKRICPCCKINEKHIYNNNKEATYCHSCLSKIRKQSRSKPESKLLQREKLIISKYNIDMNDYNEMLKSQDYKCLICYTSKSELKYNLFVDHCHITGKVRGLLCHGCNIGLGFFKDNINSLNNAITYLKIAKNHE